MSLTRSSNVAGEASKDGDDEVEDENFDLQGEFQEDSLLELSTCSSLSISLNGSLPLEPVQSLEPVFSLVDSQDNSEDCDVTPSNNDNTEDNEETDLANNNNSCQTEDEATDLETDPETLETSDDHDENPDECDIDGKEAKGGRAKSNGVELEYEYEPGISLSSLEFASAPDLFSETKCFLCGFDSETGRNRNHRKFHSSDYER